MSITRANHCTTAAAYAPATSQQSLVTSIKCKSSYSNKYDKLTSTILNSDSTRVSCAVAVCDWSSALRSYNTQVIHRTMMTDKLNETKKTEIQSRNTSLTMTLQLPVTNIFDLPLVTRLPWSSDDTRCRGLVMTRLIAVCESVEQNPTVGSCVYHDNHCNIQLWTLTAHRYCTVQVHSVFHSA